MKKDIINIILAFLIRCAFFRFVVRFDTLDLSLLSGTKFVERDACGMTSDRIRSTARKKVFVISEINS